MKLNFKEKITFSLLHIVSAGLRLLPRRVSLAIGRGLGLFVWSVYPLRRATCMKNLAIAFPDNSEIENKHILKRTYLHFGMVMVDMLWTPRLTKANLSKTLAFAPGSLELLQKAGRGIIVSGHIGSWEIFLPAMGLNQLPFTGIALVQKNRGSSEFFRWLRESSGTKILLKRRDSTREMIKVLHGGFLGLASDQYAGKNGVKIKFFGKETSTPVGAALFHLKTGTPFFFATNLMQDDRRYRVSVKQLTFDDLPEDLTAAITVINRRYHQELEQVIRQHPDQYFWFHRKWRKA